MDKVIHAIIEAHYEKSAARAIYRLRRFPAKDWDSDDSVMRTLWDHWKREMQEEHSVFHDLIEELVGGIVRRVVDGLSHEDGALMTRVTDDWIDLREKPDEPRFFPGAVAAEVMRRVDGRACDEPHRREVQRLLDARDRDRYERDIEPYRVLGAQDQA